MTAKLSPPSWPETWFMGVRMTQLSAPQVLVEIATRRPDAPFTYITTPNAQHITRLCRKGSFIGGLHEAAWMRLNDSQAMRILAQWLFSVRLLTFPGSDLTDAVLRQLVHKTEPVVVIGGSDRLAAELRRQFGLVDLRMHIPPMGFIHNEQAVAEAAAFVVANPARFVFIAVGFPQGDQLALRIQQEGGARGIGLCIGGSLLFSTGLVQRAPRLVRRAGLEWLYRFVQNPRRHFRRLTVHLLPIFWLALRARISPRSGPWRTG